MSCRNRRRRRRRRRGGAASTPNDRDENTSSPQISRWEVDVRECPAQTSASTQRIYYSGGLVVQNSWALVRCRLSGTTLQNAAAEFI